jgi:dienelactone hydrolase
MRHLWTFAATLLLLLAFPGAKIVAFPSGNITLHGVLYKPSGAGPFPAVLYNHGSAPGMYSNEAIEALGPLFASHGWVFFAPYRRGQGLSAAAGTYIGDEIAAAVKKGGIPAGAATMIRLLETNHLNDQMAALAWLQKQDFVQPHRIATAGNSFGGIEAVLGAEHGAYCSSSRWGRAGLRVGRRHLPCKTSWFAIDNNVYYTHNVLLIMLGEFEYLLLAATARLGAEAVGREFHPLNSSAFHGALFQQSCHLFPAFHWAALSGVTTCSAFSANIANNN